MIIKGGTLNGGTYRDQFKPVTNGIKLFLDAGNPESYPGSGTTWYDISGEGYTAAIQEGMTYSAANGGVFNFDGNTSAYAQLGSGFGYDYGAGVTVNVWANFEVWAEGGNWERLIDFGNGAPANNIILCRRETTNNLVMDIEGVNGDSMVPGDPSIDYNTWTMYTMLADGTYWKIYKNGVLQCTEANTGVPATITRDNNYIGKSNWIGSLDANFLGSMSVIQLYSYALNEQQITQNFNYFRGRYGV